METKFNFKSQICTTREQSERLLSLGLKKETADMRWERISKKYGWYVSAKTPYASSDIPAWSLHRLLCMLPSVIPIELPCALRGGPSLIANAFLLIDHNSIRYQYEDLDDNTCCLHGCFSDNDMYFNAIFMIEWLIKEGYFNKEYLEERK